MNPSKRATMSDILSHWWVNLGHKMMPDSQPYVCPMVLQPMPPCQNERLSSESDGELEPSARPNTQQPLKGILKKPKMTDSRVESKSTVARNENSVPLKSHSGNESVYTSATQEWIGSDVPIKLGNESNFHSGSQSGEIFSSNADSNGKKIFDAQRMPARSILKRKGKFSSGDSGCELNDSKSKSSSISSNSVDLSEVDSAIDSPDYTSAISSKDSRKDSGSLTSSAFDFMLQRESSVNSGSSSDIGEGLNIAVLPLRKGILKNRNQSKDEANKRLSACSIGSNSSADMLDFSYDSYEDLLSPHYYRQQSPHSSGEYEGDSSVSSDRHRQLDDFVTYEEAKQVYTKALEICKNV